MGGWGGVSGWVLGVGAEGEGGAHRQGTASNQEVSQKSNVLLRKAHDGVFKQVAEVCYAPSRWIPWRLTKSGEQRNRRLQQDRVAPGLCFLGDEGLAN